MPSQKYNAHMAIHNDLSSMSREAIEEYLAIAHHCVTSRKPTGGAYGYPAVLLLFSIVDALSNYAGYPEHSFLVLKDIFPNLTDAQVKHLKNWYRHLPAHQAILMPGVAISVDEPGDAIAITQSGEPTHIRLLQFWTAIKKYWDTKAIVLNPSYQKQKAPNSPVTLNLGAPSASGQYVNTSTDKK